MQGSEAYVQAIEKVGIVTTAEKDSILKGLKQVLLIMCLGVCVCVCARAHMCMSACVRVCVCVFVYV